MEVLTWPKQALEEKYATCPTLSELVKTLEAEVQADGKVICKVRVNGLDFSENDEQRFGASSLAEVQEIQVEIESVAVLVRDTAASLNEFIGNLASACLDGAEEFRTGARFEATRRFSEIVEATQWLTQALVAIKHNWINHVNESVTDTWTANEVHMKAAVQELLSAYEARDFVLASDVLEYELHTSLLQWMRILKIDG